MAIPPGYATAFDLGARYQVALLRAKHRALTGRPVEDALVEEIARVSPMDPAALEVLAYVAARRGEHAAAYDRLRYLYWHGYPPAFVTRLRERVDSFGGTK